MDNRTDNKETYYFSDPKFIGKSYILEDSMSVVFERKKPIDFPLDPEMSDLEKKLLEAESYDIDGALNGNSDKYISFYAHETLGASIGHAGAMAGADFT